MAEVEYVSWIGHGAVNISPPGIFRNAAAYGFVADASYAAMQGLTDKLLNDPADGAVCYTVLGFQAMLSFMDMPRCESGAEPIGWQPGRECAIWIPLLETRLDDPLNPRLVLWAPYILINYAAGMVIGRETWGWAKELATISIATDDPLAPSFGCATTYYPTLSANTQAETGTLYEIKPGLWDETVKPVEWNGGQEMVDALNAKLGSEATKLVDAFWGGLQANCVAFKQFRASSKANHACYQAIVSSPIGVTNFHCGGPLLSTFNLRIRTCESHQIVQDIFGFEPDPEWTEIPVLFGFWSTIDFQTLPGDDVVVLT